MTPADDRGSDVEPAPTGSLIRGSADASAGYREAGAADASERYAAGEPRWSSGRRALAWLAAGAVVAIAWLAQPFATGLLLGALMAFTLQPLHVRLVRWTGQPVLMSVLTVLTAGLSIVAGAVVFASLFVTRAVRLANVVREELRAGGAISSWLTEITDRLGRFVSPETVRERLGSAAGDVASSSAAVAGTVASTTIGSLLGLFFALLTMHVILRHWPRMAVALEEVSPLRREHTRALLEELRQVGRTTLSGTVLTGLVQGALAALGFWVTGVPQPVFLGAATAIASLVPAVGTLLVWVPAGLYLLAIDHTAMATLLFAWGALMVVGFSDYVVRPRLVGDEGMPAVLTFLALFGGLEVLGLRGLIAGPVVMALAVSILRLYAREVRRR